LVNVAGIFYILIVGLTLAIVIAVLEFLVKANKEARQTRVNCFFFPKIFEYLLFVF